LCSSTGSQSVIGKSLSLVAILAENFVLVLSVIQA
jgi:hypothetical protein